MKSKKWQKEKELTALLVLSVISIFWCIDGGIFCLLESIFCSLFSILLFVASHYGTLMTSFCRYIILKISLNP